MQLHNKTRTISQDLIAKILDIINDHPDRTWTAGQLCEYMTDIVPVGVIGEILRMLYKDSFIEIVGTPARRRFRAIRESEIEYDTNESQRGGHEGSLAKVSILIVEDVARSDR